MSQHSLPDYNKIAQELYKKNVELLVQRRRTEKLLYSVSEAIIAVDSNLNITLFNKAAGIMTGFKSHEAMGKNLTEILDLNQKSGIKLEIQNYCFKKINEEILGLNLKGKKREYFVNYSSSTIQYESGEKECLITLTDVTHEKKLEKTKDEFISVTSHELRTPMTIIKSYLWMVLAGKSGEVNEKQKEYLNKAMLATERMISLINDILNVAKLEQQKIIYNKDIIDINSFVKEIISDLKIKADEKNIYLKLETDDTRKYVISDSNKLREVFVNLIGNSLKFTREGGITVKLEESKEHILISICDTGAGIDKDDQKRLFHKFGRLDSSYQTVAETGGTGFGLYIVKLYIEGMGGKIGAKSEGKGKGSTFWFLLPKA
jgi:two-component system sensor histidine kinase VicK